MIQSAPPISFLPKSGVSPTLDEYKSFHGMVCGVSASRRCIQSFDGCALFAPLSSYEEDRDIVTFDYNRTFPRFTLFNYYALVVLSLTGLLTLLGRTQLLLCREEAKEIVLSGKDNLDNTDKSNQAIAIVSAESFEKQKLYVPAKVIRYIQDRSIALEASDNNDTKHNKNKESKERPKVMLQKRFEFKFGNYADVVMFHFVCSNGYKYLVEVYQAHTWYGTAVPKLVEALKEKLFRLKHKNE